MNASAMLFGTLNIEGGDSYYVVLKQQRLAKTWYLLTKDTFDQPKRQENTVAIILSKVTGSSTGYGKVYILSRVLDIINRLSGKATPITSYRYEYVSAEDGESIYYQIKQGAYSELDLNCDGMTLSIRQGSGVKLSQVWTPDTYTPLMERDSSSAVIAGLGARTFELLCKQHGNDFDFVYDKNYKMVETNEEFDAMATDLLDSIQEAANKGSSILVTIDTETTGLNVYGLSPDNPDASHVVAIPMGWKNDTAYLINIDMAYFGNVDSDKVFPLFTKLFSRNPDYTYQDIELDYGDRHYKFNRRNINLVGVNSQFDIMAMKCHGADIFFDEDIQVMCFNLATDWSRGRLGLKKLTKRIFGITPAELDDLFGKGNEDKFRYLSDRKLALLYGGADGDFPRQIWRKLRRMTPDKLYLQYRKYDMTALYRCAQATWRGMYVDEKAVIEQGEMLKRDIEVIQDFIYTYADSAVKLKTRQLSDSLDGNDGDAEEVPITFGKQYRYPFTPENHKWLLFTVCGYPIIKVSEATGKISMDKDVLQRLAKFQRDAPSNVLRHDIPSSYMPDKPLISAKDFNTDKYPLARVFQTYATLNKEYTSYYKPIMTHDMESRMFYRFNLQKAATRRILSPGQTMKGALKRLVIQRENELSLVFDASQIEYRHMASMAYQYKKSLLMRSHPDTWEAELAKLPVTKTVEMMTNPEADYHIETASALHGVPTYKVTHSLRKQTKSLGFGIPYGLGLRKMCENLFGKVTAENLDKTKKLLALYKQRQPDVMEYLEHTRDTAFIPEPITDEFREFLDIGEYHVGMVRNCAGFYRMFILKDLDNKAVGSIRRKAGNCGIQGGAAELFRRMLYGFWVGCCEAGIQNKVHIYMLVHDEIDINFDYDIDVLKLIEIIHDRCTLRYPDQIPYFVGIGVGDSWYNAKSDDAELPEIMVQRMLDKYKRGQFSIPSDGNQHKYLSQLRRHYMCDRLKEELQKIIPDLASGYKWTQETADKVDGGFENYIVRAYLSVFSNSDTLLEKLIDWQAERDTYGFNVGFLDKPILSEAEQVIADVGHIDLLEEDELEIEEEDFFSEESLFDDSAMAEGLSESADYGRQVYTNEPEVLEQEEETYTISKNPTNSFDILVSAKYIRKCIIKSNDSTYTILLPVGTDVGKVNRVVRASLSSGDGTIMLVGSGVKVIKGVSIDADELDNLDKDLCKLFGRS